MWNVEVEWTTNGDTGKVFDGHGGCSRARGGEREIESECMEMAFRFRDRGGPSSPRGKGEKNSESCGHRHGGREMREHRPVKRKDVDEVGSQGPLAEEGGDGDLAVGIGKGGPRALVWLKAWLTRSGENGLRNAVPTLFWAVGRDGHFVVPLSPRRIPMSTCL